MIMEWIILILYKILKKKSVTDKIIKKLWNFSSLYAYKYQ